MASFYLSVNSCPRWCGDNIFFWMWCIIVTASPTRWSGNDQEHTATEFICCLVSRASSAALIADWRIERGLAKVVSAVWTGSVVWGLGGLSTCGCGSMSLSLIRRWTDTSASWQPPQTNLATQTPWIIGIDRNDTRTTLMKHRMNLATANPMSFLANYMERISHTIPSARTLGTTPRAWINEVVAVVASESWIRDCWTRAPICTR